MKIATWNIERLKHKADIDKILLKCNQINADILILTETDEQVKPHYKYYYSTPNLYEIQPDWYKSTENRVSIFSNYNIIRFHETYDKYTSLCIEFETEYGNLIVYGTILGIYGNRHKNFLEDLNKQLSDYKRLSSMGNLCIAGDYNLSICDNYYYTKAGRENILKTFEETHIKILTANTASCIDHIAISENFIANTYIKVNEWNLNKKLSDHKGIVVSISNPNTVYGG